MSLLDDMLASSETLREARARVLAGRADGIVCPCCDQFAKIYKRKLNSGIARALIYLYQLFSTSENAWGHAPSYLNNRKANPTNDFALLLHWRLLEAMPGERDDGSKRIGYYRMTPLGFDFVRGIRTVPKHVYLYNQTCLGFSDEITSIQEALASAFDYAELMAGR